MTEHHNEQLHLPGMAPPPQRNVISDDMLLPKLTFSHSSLNDFNNCKRYYFLKGWGAWGGWMTGAPLETRLRYLRKAISNRFGVIGNYLHELIARKAFRDVDLCHGTRTRITPRTDEELRRDFMHRLKTAWRASSQLSWDSILKEVEKERRQSKRKARKKLKKPEFWLWEHESGGYPTGYFPLRPTTTEDRRRCGRDAALWKKEVVEWVEPSLDWIFSPDWEKLVGTLNVDDWLVIEGNRLEKGLIVPDAADGPPQSQFSLREKRVFPSIDVEVNGTIWKHHITMDRVVRKASRIEVIDYKSGRTERETGRPKQSAVEQMLSYGAELAFFFPDAREDNIALTLAYLRNEPADGVFTFELAMNEIAQRQKQTREAIALIADHFEPLTRENFQRMNYLPQQILSKLDRKFPEGQLVALEENFPATAVEEGRVKTCQYCTMLKVCKEGRAFVELGYPKS